MALFKRSDPVCGMKETRGTGIDKMGKWFCSDKCYKEYQDMHAAHNAKGEGEKCC